MSAYQRSATRSLCHHPIYTAKAAATVDPKHRIITLCRCPWLMDARNKTEKDFPVAK
jgi:hypothetical protein